MRTDFPLPWPLPHVAVVTVVRNDAAHIAQPLASVLGQDYPHLEHIVIDGGSTDGTVELLKSRDVRFISEPDSGQTNAINKGFRLARVPGGTARPSDRQAGADVSSVAGRRRRRSEPRL